MKKYFLQIHLLHPFIIKNCRAVFTGKSILYFPANSVCDPARSTYGATEWDKDCTTLDDGQSVKIRAVLALTSDGLAIDFSPALRFSPATTVTISTGIFAPLIKLDICVRLSLKVAT